MLTSLHQRTKPNDGRLLDQRGCASPLPWPRGLPDLNSPDPHEPRAVMAAATAAPGSSSCLAICPPLRVHRPPRQCRLGSIARRRRDLAAPPPSPTRSLRGRGGGEEGSERTRNPTAYFGSDRTASANGRELPRRERAWPRGLTDGPRPSEKWLNR